MNRLQELAGINESSMSRVFQHVEDEDKDFGIMSASRGDLSREDNDKRHAELKKSVRDMGFGYIEMRGGYKEEDAGDGDGFVHEKSLFIPNIPKDKLTALGNKYNQDSVMHKDGNGFVYIGTNEATGVGKELMRFKKGEGKSNMDLSKQAIKNFFSELTKGSHRGKKFVFTPDEESEEKGASKKKDGDFEVKNKETGSEYHVQHFDPDKHELVIQELEHGSFNRAVQFHTRGIKRKWFTILGEVRDEE